MYRTTNVAKSLQTMVPAASAYMRLSSPAPGMEQHVRLDPQSEWSASALLCMGMETVTLPTRLRDGKGRIGSLTEMEAILNTTGSRNVFELRANLGVGAKGSRGTTGAVNGHGKRTTTDAGQVEFIGYLPRLQRTTRPTRKSHLFSQIAVYREPAETDSPVQEDNRMDRDTIVER
jgi:hypothetical protein